MSDARLSFGVVGPTLNFTTEVVLSETNAQRVLNYLTNGSVHGKIPQEDGTEVQATTEEAAQRFALSTLESLLMQTVRYEKQKAAKAAESGVPDITANTPA